MRPTRLRASVRTHRGPHRLRAVPPDCRDTAMLTPQNALDTPSCTLPSSDMGARRHGEFKIWIAMPAVEDSFGRLRDKFKCPIPAFMALVQNVDELDRMDWRDGLKLLSDGPYVQTKAVSPASDHVLEVPAGLPLCLWVIREDDVVYAETSCEFGRNRSRGEVKHTNLTGGRDAFGGGEMFELGNGILLLNGDSGRYRIRSEVALWSIFLAFVESGYGVWGLGWDHEGGRPIPADAGGMPTWVE